MIAAMTSRRTTAPQCNTRVSVALLSFTLELHVALSLCRRRRRAGTLAGACTKGSHRSAGDARYSCDCAGHLRNRGNCRNLAEAWATRFVALGTPFGRARTTRRTRDSDDRAPRVDERVPTWVDYGRPLAETAAMGRGMP